MSTDESFEGTTVSMQNIYENIFIDVCDALCGCRACEIAQPIRPTFDDNLTYVAREEDVATLFVYCKHLVPIHFVTVKLTTLLLRSRGMTVQDIKHRLEFPVDALSYELRTQFPSSRRDIIFDARVFEVIRKIMHETSEETQGNLPVGLSSVTPIDYFHDIRPQLVMYADILSAAHAALSGAKLGKVKARFQIVATPEPIPEPTPEPIPEPVPVHEPADSMAALADLIREFELEEAAKKKPKQKKGRAPSTSVAAAPATTKRAEAPVPEKLCTVCMDAHVAVMINACGHVILCEDCYDRTDMKHCPLCQSGQTCTGTVVWPQADERPPMCKKCACMFPTGRCACGVMTCGSCGPCRCKRSKKEKPSKLFWV